MRLLPLAGLLLALATLASEATAGTTVETIDGVVVRRGTGKGEAITGGNGPRPEELWGCGGGDRLRGGKAVTLFVPGRGNDTIYAGPRTRGYLLRSDGRNGNDVIFGYEPSQVIYFAGTFRSRDMAQGTVAEILYGGRRVGWVTFWGYHGALRFANPDFIPRFVGKVCD